MEKKIDFGFSIYKSVMSKATSKMNKKELIEKIKQLEQDKEKADHREQELCGFIVALNLKDVFAKSIILQRRTGRYVIDFSDVKKTIGETNCPDWEYGIEEQNIDKDNL